jgi:hypothetical protein
MNCKKMWKEAVVVEVKVLSRHLSGGVEENHVKLSSG